ncbi:MAG: hypothetical protein ACOCZE_10760 [Planctomycetota bacterium]
MKRNGELYTAQKPAVRTIEIPLPSQAAALQRTDELTVEIHGQRIHLALPHVDEPQSLSWLCPIAQWLSQEIMKVHQDFLSQNGVELACRSGCTHCCHLLIPVSVPEAMFIADWLEGHSPAQLRCLRQRFADSSRVYDIAAEQICQDPTIGRMISTRLLMRTASAQQQAHSPCPLLWEGLCSQYLTRPIACREHVSRSADPICKPADKVIRPPLSMLETLIQTCADVEGSRQEIVPFRRLFAWADTHRRRWQRTYQPSAMLEAMQSVINRLQSRSQPA